MKLDFCPLDAVDRLTEFLREHWDVEHILVRSRKLLDWQYRDEGADRYNFLLAEGDDGAIAGVLGFIPASRYDSSLGRGDETIWLAVWKVKEGGPAGLGLVLLRTLERKLQPKWIGTVGLNPRTEGVYKVLGYRTGILNRYYRLNDTLRPYRIAQVPSEWRSPLPRLDTGQLEDIPPDALFAVSRGLGLEHSGHAPRKSLAQFAARYFEHPFYRYRLYLARTGEASAIIAVRSSVHERSCALRIVDLLGEPEALAGCGASFDILMREANAEYIDFHCSAGVSALYQAGFSLFVNSDPIVLPYYFEPFESANATIAWSMKGPGDRFILCKADADQDRPNLLTEASA